MQHFAETGLAKIQQLFINSDIRKLPVLFERGYTTMMWPTIILAVLFVAFMFALVAIAQGMGRAQTRADMSDAYMGALGMTILASLVMFTLLAYHGSVVWVPWPQSPWLAGTFAAFTAYFVTRQYLRTLRALSCNEPEG